MSLADHRKILGFPGSLQESLSPWEGRALIEGVFRIHAKDMEKLAEVLTPAERIHLVKALKKLGKHALAVLDHTQTDFESEETRKPRAMPVMPPARPLKERFGPPV